MTFPQMRLATVCKMRTGKLNSNAAIENGEYPFFTCAQQTYKIDKFAFDTDAVLLAGNNANGVYPLKYYSGKFNAYQRTYVFESLDKKLLNIRFLYYALIPALERFQSASIGAATQYLTKALLDNFLIGVPDMRTQNGIVATLSAYDDLIENNRRRIALLEEAARQLYKEWFVRFRFPGHEHVKIIDGVPDGWEMLPLGSICTRITDGSHASPKAVEDGFPMASVKDMEDWRLDVSSCRQISPDDYETLLRYDCKPLKGDVLIAKDGSYLKHCFVVQEDVDLVILSSIAILRPNERIDPFLLAFTLKDPKVKEMMAGYVSGVALPRIILKEFRGFRVLVPEKRIQDAWADLVHPFCKEADVLLKQSDALTKARNLLLPKLMSGAIAV